MNESKDRFVDDDENTAVRERPVILLLVEGLADASALKKLYQHCYPEALVEVIGEDDPDDDKDGDITTKYVNGKPSTGASILDRVANRICDHLEAKNRQGWIEGCYIIHITDTDGAWIADKNVVESKTLLNKSPQYEDTRILTNPGKTKSIQARNYQKKLNTENLRWTLSMKLNWQQEMPEKLSAKKTRFKSEVPIHHESVSSTACYRIYYMSCNLDHVLHENANLPEKDKIPLANAFMERYKDNLDAYIEYLHDLMPECEAELHTIKRRRKNLPYIDQLYEASWEYIQKGTRSLARGTNVWLSFNQPISMENSSTPSKSIN